MISSPETMTTPWGVSLTCHYREGKNDRNTMISCIKNDEYNLAKFDLKPGQVAIDLGAHIGGATLAMASLGLKVHAVEPLPENIELLIENIASNDLADTVRLYPNAIAGNETKEVSIFYMDNTSKFGKAHEFIGADRSWAFSSAKKAEYHKERRHYSAKAVTLEQVFTVGDIETCHLLKVDCEGGEWEAFSDLPESVLKSTNLITGELHAFDSNDVAPDSLLPYLKEHFIDVTQVYEPTYGTPGRHSHFVYKNKRLS